jgi:hypothetical protein
MTPLAATSISIDGHKENYGRDGNLKGLSYEIDFENVDEN